MKGRARGLSEDCKRGGWGGVGGWGGGGGGRRPPLHARPFPELAHPATQQLTPTRPPTRPPETQAGRQEGRDPNMGGGGGGISRRSATHRWCPWLSAMMASRSGCMCPSAARTTDSSSTNASIASAQPCSAAEEGGGRQHQAQHTHPLDGAPRLTPLPSHAAPQRGRALYPKGGLSPGAGRADACPPQGRRKPATSQPRTCVVQAGALLQAVEQGWVCARFQQQPHAVCGARAARQHQRRLAVHVLLIYLLASSGKPEWPLVSDPQSTQPHAVKPH